jgi:two-component sensor histidine kinase
MSRPILEVLVPCLAVGLALAVFAMMHQRRIARASSSRATVLLDELRAMEKEARYLAEVRLPALAESFHEPSVQVPGLLHERLAGSPYGRSLQRATELFAQSVGAAQARADHSARAALMTTMRALQSLASDQQMAISDMQNRYDHAGILADLLKIDHTNAQFGRRAQAIAVLCGAWPGRQRAAATLEDVVRGATSRISDYLRVRTVARVDIAVSERVVEPVVLAVAELLDNAARHSPPSTEVQVNVYPTHNGAVIVIDDCGVGMHEEEKVQAARLLSGTRAVDVTQLGDPPQFGFSVIGVLAQRYGFTISVDSQSPYGGVRAVLYLPHTLLTHLTRREPVQPPASERGTVPAPAPAPAPAPVSAPSPVPAPVPEPTTPSTGEFPQRRRRDAVPGLQASPSPAQAVEQRPAEQAAAILGAFQRGTRAGRMSTPPEGNPPGV